MKFLSYIATLLLLLNACTRSADENYERFYVRFEGADLAVQVEGQISSGIIILILHGGPGSNGLSYNVGRYSDLLEADFAVAYMDQRGHGSSQGNYDRDKVSLIQLARDAEHIVKALKLKYGSETKVFLMGHSWGGLVGTKALLDTDISSIIEGWIEADGAHDIPKLNRELVKMFRFYAEDQISKENEVEFWTNEVLSLIDKIDTNNIAEEQSFAMNRLAYRAQNKIPEVLKPEPYKVNKFSKKSSPYGIMSDISEALTAIAISDESDMTSLTNRLSEITLPTLLIWGKYDFVTPPSLGNDAFNFISSSNKSFHLLEQSGHSSMINEPVLFCQLIKDFINSVPE